MGLFYLAPASANHPQTNSVSEWITAASYSQKQQIHAQANWQGETMKMKEYSSSIALWFGGVTAGIGVLTLSDWAMITGIICTLGTFALNWYYKQKELQLRMGVGNVTSPEK